MECIELSRVIRWFSGVLRRVSVMYFLWWLLGPLPPPVQLLGNTRQQYVCTCTCVCVGCQDYACPLVSQLEWHLFTYCWYITFLCMFSGVSVCVNELWHSFLVLSCHVDSAYRMIDPGNSLLGAVLVLLKVDMDERACASQCPYSTVWYVRIHAYVRPLVPLHTLPSQCVEVCYSTQ